MPSNHVGGCFPMPSRGGGALKWQTHFSSERKPKRKPTVLGEQLFLKKKHPFRGEIK